MMYCALTHAIISALAREKRGLSAITSMGRPQSVSESVMRQLKSVGWDRALCGNSYSCESFREDMEGFVKAECHEKGKPAPALSWISVLDRLKRELIADDVPTSTAQTERRMNALQDLANHPSQLIAWPVVTERCYDNDIQPALVFSLDSTSISGCCRRQARGPLGGGQPKGSDDAGASYSDMNSSVEEDGINGGVVGANIQLWKAKN